MLRPLRVVEPDEPVRIGIPLEERNVVSVVDLVVPIGRLDWTITFRLVVDVWTAPTRSDGPVHEDAPDGGGRGIPVALDYLDIRQMLVPHAAEINTALVWRCRPNGQ
jgi:hypothetical protein